MDGKNNDEGKLDEKKADTKAEKNTEEENEIDKYIFLNESENEKKLNELRSYLERISDNERSTTTDKNVKNARTVLMKITDEVEDEEERISLEEVQNMKKVREIKELEMSLRRKINVLDTKIQATESALKLKSEELESLTQAEKEKAEEFFSQMDDYWKNYSHATLQFEKEYLEYEHQRGIKMFSEAVRDKVSEENKRLILMEIIRRQRELEAKREEDLILARTKMEKEISEITEKVADLKNKIDLLEHKYQSQYDMYLMSLKAKEAAQVS